MQCSVCPPPELAGWALVLAVPVDVLGASALRREPPDLAVRVQRLRSDLSAPNQQHGGSASVSASHCGTAA
jgi:hypothetical protein